MISHYIEVEKQFFHFRLLNVDIRIRSVNRERKKNISDR